MSEDEPASKKRSRPADELEIDVDAAEPLSKRAARKLKKGKSLKKAPTDAHNEDNESDSDDVNTKEPAQKEEYKKGTNGIWIGNLSFKITEAELVAFFTSNKPLGKTKKTSEYTEITKDDITRISFPMEKNQNKGFAYIDFKTPEHQETAIALSERILNGRNVLIKPADSFDGRPKKETVDDEKATKILYIGNLPFDITTVELSTYLGSEKAGIKKVRMATFEDSGKCKGFAFIDFQTPEQVGVILKNKKLHSLNGRKLKLEYGEDRSLRRKPRPEGAEVKTGRKTPGSVLAFAQRGSTAIATASGMKTTFD